MTLSSAGNAVRTGLVILGLIASFAACGASDSGSGMAASVNARLHRYGVFRDLVWFAPRPGGGTGTAAAEERGFFLDRFEVTQGEWRVYRAAQGEDPAVTAAAIAGWSVGQVVDPVWPMTGMNLQAARRFARWRFGRLPRYEEWRIAATAYGQYLLPWGNLPRAAYANTEELRHGSMTPVGTFESARQPDGPYDLIGNAGEWTETLHVDWQANGPEPGRRRSTPAEGVRVRTAVAARHPALRPYWRTAVLLPQAVLVASDSAAIARRIAGGSDRPMLERGFGAPGAAYRWPEARDARLGMRVAADPAMLVAALRAEAEAPDARGEMLLRGFLQRNAERMRPAWTRAKAAQPAAAALDLILQSELGS